MPDALLRAMDTGGVAYAMLVQPSVYGADHRFLFDTVRAHPGRFMPLALIDPAEPEAVQTAVELVDAGCAGFRINLSLNVQKAAAQLERPTWSDLVALGVPICLRAMSGHHDLVRDALAHGADCPIVIDHLGLPSQADPLELTTARLGELAGFPHCSLKIAGLARLSRLGAPYTDVWPLVEAAVEAFGCSRLIWGSDYPNVDGSAGYGVSLDAIRSMPFVSTIDREQLLAGSSLALWGNPDPGDSGSAARDGVHPATHPGEGSS